VRSSVRFSAEISGEGDREDIVERCSGMGDTLGVGGLFGRRGYSACAYRWLLESIWPSAVDCKCTCGIRKIFCAKHAPIFPILSLHVARSPALSKFEVVILR
jgi:hypothetical protein